MFNGDGCTHVLRKPTSGYRGEIGDGVSERECSSESPGCLLGGLGGSGHWLGWLCYQELSLWPLAGALPRPFPCAYALSQVLTLAGAQALPGEAQNGKLKPHSGKMKALRAAEAVSV